MESEGAMLMLCLFLFFSGAWYDCCGNPLPSMYSQAPMVMPPPVYQPSNYDMSLSSGHLHGNPSLMTSSQDSLVARSEAWNATYPLTVPPGLPPSVPGGTNLQVPWSTCEWQPKSSVKTWGDSVFFSLKTQESGNTVFILNLSILLWRKMWN